MGRLAGELWGFFRRKKLTFEQAVPEVEIQPIVSANIDWYLLAPIFNEPPLTSFEALHDQSWPRPRVTLEQLADMHEAMAEKSEYHRRYQAAMERKNKKDRP